MIKYDKIQRWWDQAWFWCRRGVVQGEAHFERLPSPDWCECWAILSRGAFGSSMCWGRSGSQIRFWSQCDAPTWWNFEQSRYIAILGDRMSGHQTLGRDLICPHVVGRKLSWWWHAIWDFSLWNIFFWWNNVKQRETTWNNVFNLVIWSLLFSLLWILVPSPIHIQHPHSLFTI